MERKLPYEEARIDVILIENADIVTTSGWQNESPDSNMDGNGWTGLGNGSW